MTEETILRIIIGVITAIGGAGSLVAWQRFRGEKRSGQLIIKAAEGAVVIQGGVLETLNSQIASLKEDMALVKMESIEIEKKHSDCEESLTAVKISLAVMQHDLASHSRMSELARRKTHVAINTLGNYELLIEMILTELRDHNIPIKDDLRPVHIRERFQEKMNALEELESRVTRQAVENEMNQEKFDATVRRSGQDEGES